MSGHRAQVPVQRRLRELDGDALTLSGLQPARAAAAREPDVVDDMALVDDVEDDLPGLHRGAREPDVEVRQRHGHRRLCSSFLRGSASPENDKRKHGHEDRADDRDPTPPPWHARRKIRDERKETLNASPLLSGEPTSAPGTAPRPDARRRPHWGSHAGLWGSHRRHGASRRRDLRMFRRRLPDGGGRLARPLDPSGGASPQLPQTGLRARPHPVDAGRRPNLRATADGASGGRSGR